MVETAPVVEKGLNTAAVPIQIGHGTINEKDGKKDRVVEMQDRSQSHKNPPALHRDRTLPALPRYLDPRTQLRLWRT